MDHTMYVWNMVLFADRQSDGKQFIKRQYSIELRSPENIIGATFYNEHSLLVYYNTSLLAIVHLPSGKKRPIEYKYLGDFHPKIVGEYGVNQLYYMRTMCVCSAFE